MFQRNVHYHQNQAHPQGNVHHGHHGNYYGHQHSHYHGHYSRRYSWGVTGIIVGSVLIIPIAILALILAISATPTTMLSAATVGAAAVGTAGTAALGVAAFGLGALIVYGVMGLCFLYSAAKECYTDDKNVMDMLRSRIIREDASTIKSIGSVLWSPFLFIGGLVGMGVKAAVSCCRKEKSESQDEEIQVTTSYSQMNKELPSQGFAKDLTSDEEPMQTGRLYPQLDPQLVQNAIDDFKHTQFPIFNV